MKTKIFTLLCLSALAVTTTQAQSFTSFELEGLTAYETTITKGTAQTSTEYSADNATTIYSLYPIGTDLSNVTANIVIPSTNSFVTDPIPTDWTKTQTVLIEKSSSYMWATIDCQATPAATLPFTLTATVSGAFVDTWDSTTAGWFYSGLHATNSNIRFGGTGAALYMGFEEEPDSIFFNIYAVSGTTNEGVVFDIQESVDGLTWTSLVQYTENAPLPVDAASSAQALKLQSTTRHIRFIYTNRVTTNVNVTGEVVITKAGDDSTTEDDIPVVVESSARINGFEIEGATAMGPFVSFNPTDNDDTNPGTIEAIYTQDVDLTNVTALFTLNSSTTSVVGDIPTDWSSTQNIHIANSEYASWYNVTCKNIIPAALPMTIDLSAGEDKSAFALSWTPETVGWAGACMRENDSDQVRFGTQGAHFIVAFEDEPDSIYYSINYGASTVAAGTVVDVEESADGETWTTLVQYTDETIPNSGMTSAEKAQAEKLLSTTRYVRWTFTTRASGTVSLTGSVSVTKAEDVPVVVESSARINGFEIEGATAMGPFVQLTPTSNDESAPGTIHVIYTPDVDLTNVTPTLTLSSSTTSVVGDLPTDWSSTQNIKVANSEYASWYNVTCKNIIPAALPMTIDLSAGEDKSAFALSWTPETVGWAGACMRENDSDQVRFGTQGAHFIVAFEDEPDSIYYSINYGAATVAAGTVVDVEESADGETWTTLVQYTDETIPNSGMTSAEKAQQQKLLSDTRYVRWMFTTRASGTVSLTGNVVVTKVGTSSSMTSASNAVEVKLSPVPAVDVLNIAAPQAVASVAICNIAGQTVASYTNVGTQVSVSNLATGSYIAIVTLADGTKTVKSFIKK